MSKAVKACSSKRPRDAGDGWEERGGYMNAKNKKLKTQFSEHETAESSKSVIFEGVAIHVNGYTSTTPTSDGLKRLMQKHGGSYVHFYNKTDVTHIIATSLPTSKINRLTNQKVVRPEWITESVDAGRLLPYQDYVLFKPKWQENRSVKDSADVTANQSIVRPNATAGNPKFLEEFYSNSRLHHISSWGSECKTYVRQLQTENSFEGKEKLLQMESKDEDDNVMTQCIMHIDMDCFFVSVGLIKRPHLRGKPVAVTHSKGRGHEDTRSEENIAYEKNHWQKKHGVSVGSRPALNSMAEIASCSYEARRAGVKNGMFFGAAKDLCPDLIPIPYDYDGYKRVSRILYDTIASFTHDIEAVSCDEMLVDLSSLVNEVQMSPLQIASVMRNDVEEKSQCTASAGIGPNILLAKMATKKAKPNGQHCIPDLTTGQEFLSDRPVKDLPGVGWSIAKKMAALSIITCGDLQNVALNALQDQFGPKMGKQLKNYSQGKDERGITSNKERKSVSAEVNYGIRFTQEGEVLNFVNQLSDEVNSRLHNIKVKGKTITLKLKVRRKGAPVETAKFLGHGICDSVNKSVSLPLATNNPEVIRREAMALMRQMNFPADDLRGIGIQVSRLESEIIAEGGTTPSILQFTSLRQNPATENLEVMKDPSPVKSHPPPSLPPLPFLPSQINPSPRPPPAPSNPPDLPSPSQIDPTFLAALPPDIRSEVENACAASHKTPKAPKPSLAFSLPQPRKTSSHGKSPSKRITMRSPGKTTHQRRVKNRSPASKSSARLNTKNRMAAKQLIYSNTPKVTEVIRPPAEATVVDEVNLCGAVSLPEVKTLLNEWIQFTEVPEAEDVVRVVGYIEALSQGKNLEMLHQVLMHVRKVILSHKKSAWLECLDQLIEQSQAIVKADYGHPLKIQY